MLPDAETTQGISKENAQYQFSMNFIHTFEACRINEDLRRC